MQERISDGLSGIGKRRCAGSEEKLSLKKMEETKWRGGRKMNGKEKSVDVTAAGTEFTQRKRVIVRENGKTKIERKMRKIGGGQNWNCSKGSKNVPRKGKAGGQ